MKRQTIPQEIRSKRRALEAEAMRDAYQMFCGADGGPQTVEKDTPHGKLRLLWLGGCYCPQWGPLPEKISRR